MTWHARSVIRIKKDDSVISKAVLFELLENLSDLDVHRGYTIIITGYGFAKGCCIRVIGRDGRFFRVVNFAGGYFGLHMFLKSSVRPDHGSRLVTGHEIEYGEEDS